jgi:AcrR family transcriptional regulator
MYKLCQTKASAARQREMELGLLRIMQECHYDEISVSDLCAELGIPRKAFYRYFSGKDGALNSMIDHALMDYDIPQMASGREDTDALNYMVDVFEYWMKQKHLLDALAKSERSGLIVQRAMAISNDLDVLPDFMHIRDQQLREYGTMFLVCGLMTMIVRWHHDGFCRSTREMAQLAMLLFTQPMFSGDR